MRAQIAWWGALIAGLSLQNAFLPQLMPPKWVPDFTRALVLWLALTDHPRGGVWYAFAAGIMVDVLSGAPLGFTAMTRLAIYGAARPGRNVLERSPLVFILGPLSVVVEGILVLTFGSSAFANTPDTWAVAGIIMRQGLLEILCVPLVFVIMELASGYRTEWGVRFDTR